MGVSANKGYPILSGVLIIRILLFRVLNEEPPFSETPILHDRAKGIRILLPRKPRTEAPPNKARSPYG